jgi:integrase
MWSLSGHLEKNSLVRLTNKNIQAFKCRGGWDVRWDDMVSGLGVRIYPSGKKAFVISYRVKGRKRLMVLGRYGVLTLDEARRIAKEKLVAAGKGDDPLLEKHREALGKTFGDLADGYLEQHSKVRKRTWKEDDRRLKQHIPAQWRSTLSEEVTRADVARVYANLGSRAPYEANRLLALLRHLFNWGCTHGYIPEGHHNPASLGREDRFREQQRKRWVTPEEVPFIAKAIDAESNIYIRSALWLYMLTGLRKAELLTVKRSRIDWTRGVLSLPETKAGEPQEVPLSGPALAILQATPALSGNPYLLPGGKPKTHLVNINDGWQRVRERATVLAWGENPEPGVSGLIMKLRDKGDGEPKFDDCRTAANASGIELPVALTDIRLHDLRRTVGSWMSQAGIDLNVIREGLRHADIGTTLRYARLGKDAAREAMEDHAKRIMDAAKRNGSFGVIEGGAATKE